MGTLPRRWAATGCGGAARALPAVVLVAVATLAITGCGSDGTTPGAPDATPGATASPRIVAAPAPVSSGTDPRPAVAYAEPPEPGVMSGFMIGTYGWAFTPTVDMEVTDLGCYDDHQDGLWPPRRVGIFDAWTDRLVASVIVGPQSVVGGAFRWESVESPVVLNAGHTYLAVSQYAPGDGIYDRTRAEVWAPEIASGELFYGDDAAGFVAPHEDNPWLCWMGPNFRFTPRPSLALP